MSTMRPIETTEPDDLVHRQRWAILTVLCLSLFLVVVDNTITNVALPTLSRELDASTSQLQWIVDAYSLVFAGLLLAFGSLADRVGRKGALQLGLVLFGATSAYAAFAGSAGELIAARAAMGVGAALVFPATLAILTNVFTDPAERAKAIGIWSAVVGLAVAMGPVTGGWLLEHFWWGSAFLINVPIVAVALLTGRRLLPTSKDSDAGRFDPVGLVSSVAAVALLVYTVIEAPAHGWASTPTILGLAVALALLGGFVAWERHRSDPMLDVRIFANPRFAAASVAIAAAFFALFGFIFLITQYFQVVRDYSALSAGLHTLPFAVGAAVTAPLAASLALRLGTRVVIITGLGAMALGFVWASTLGADSSYGGHVAGCMVLIAAGLSFTSAPATEVIMGSLPRHKAGVGSAVNDTTRELGGTFGVAVVGSVFSSVYGPRLVDLLGGLPVPPSAIAAAEESVVAASEVARQAPPAARETILDAARSAFLDGMAAGTRVAAIAAVMGIALAVVALPGREAARSAADEPPTGPEPVASGAVVTAGFEAEKAA